MDEPRQTAAVTVLGRLAYWSPVGIAALVFAQVFVLGLRPTKAESLRLEQQEVLLRARHRSLEAQNRDLVDLLRARRDPIYLERERRLQRAARPSVEVDLTPDPALLTPGPEEDQR